MKWKHEKEMKESNERKKLRLAILKPTMQTYVSSNNQNKQKTNKL